MKTNSEQERTLEEIQNRTETGQTFPRSAARRKAKLPKTHQDYGFSRLRKRTFVGRDGTTPVEIPTWQVRLFHAGREGWFNLDTANQAAAAAKARDTYAFLRVNGWEATLAKFKPESDAAPRLDLTVGAYLDVIKSTGHLRLRTFLNYQNCLRTIVSDAFGLKADKSRFDYRQGGNAEWVKGIDSIRLERVTAWQQKRLKVAGNSPTAIASAKRTVNSYVRCARSLFSKKLIGFILRLMIAPGKSRLTQKSRRSCANSSPPASRHSSSRVTGRRATPRRGPTTGASLFSTVSTNGFVPRGSLPTSHCMKCERKLAP